MTETAEEKKLDLETLEVVKPDEDDGPDESESGTKIDVKDAKVQARLARLEPFEPKPEKADRLEVVEAEPPEEWM